MCVLCGSFVSQVRPRNFGCVAIGSAVLVILRSRLLLFSAGSGLNRGHIVLSGFNVIVLYFDLAKTACRYSCMYLLVALLLVCIYVMVMSSSEAMT